VLHTGDVEALVRNLEADRYDQETMEIAPWLLVIICLWVWFSLRKDLRRIQRRAEEEIGRQYQDKESASKDVAAQLRKEFQLERPPHSNLQPPQPVPSLSVEKRRVDVLRPPSGIVP